MGVLENGSDKDMRDAKRTYWRLYKRYYQRNYRNEVVEKTLRFTPNEYATVSAQAETRKQSIHKYLKSCALAQHATIQPSLEKALLHISLIQSDLENTLRNNRGLDNASKNTLQSVLKDLAQLPHLMEYDN